MKQGYTSFAARKGPVSEDDPEGHYLTSLAFQEVPVEFLGSLVSDFFEICVLWLFTSTFGEQCLGQTRRILAC